MITCEIIPTHLNEFNRKDRFTVLVCEGLNEKSFLSASNGKYLGCESVTCYDLDGTKRYRTRYAIAYPEGTILKLFLRTDNKEGFLYIRLSSKGYYNCCSLDEYSTNVIGSIKASFDYIDELNPENAFYHSSPEALNYFSPNVIRK